MKFPILNFLLDSDLLLNESHMSITNLLNSCISDQGFILRFLGPLDKADVQAVVEGLQIYSCGPLDHCSMKEMDLFASGVKDLERSAMAGCCDIFRMLFTTHRGLF